MSETELRCDNSILHGKLVDGLIEVKCKSARCGSAPGVVVLHRFDALNGELVRTLMFKDPASNKEDEHGARNQRAAVRSA